MHLIFYPRRKDPPCFSGPETRVHRMLADGDTTWLPPQRCKLLDESEAAGAAEERGESEAAQARREIAGLAEQMRGLEERLEARLKAPQSG